MAVSNKLDKLKSQLNLSVDKQAISEIIENLNWAAENSTVVGLHQIGEALEDTMGFNKNDPNA